MKMLRAVVLVTCGLLLLALDLPVVGQSGIVVNGASTTKIFDTTASSTVNNLLGEVQARAVAEFANSTFHPTLITPPESLQVILSAVPSRVVAEFANGNRHLALTYPWTLLNDTTAPVGSNFASAVIGNDTKITWKTDEFTRYTLRYGTQPGNYTETVENELYAKEHTTTLSGLVSGVTYYFQVTYVDQSGNQSISPELNFIAGPTPTPLPTPTSVQSPSKSVFLPLVRR